LPRNPSKGRDRPLQSRRIKRKRHLEIKPGGEADIGGRVGVKALAGAAVIELALDGVAGGEIDGEGFGFPGDTGGRRGLRHR